MLFILFYTIFLYFTFLLKNVLFFKYSSGFASFRTFLSLSLFFLDVPIFSPKLFQSTSVSTRDYTLSLIPSRVFSPAYYVSFLCAVTFISKNQFSETHSAKFTGNLKFSAFCDFCRFKLFSMF